MAHITHNILRCTMVFVQGMVFDPVVYYKLNLLYERERS